MMSLTLLELVAFGMICLALLLGLLRLLLGPSAGDRIVAADTMSVTTTATIAGLAALLDTPLYLDVAMIFGVLSFVFVVAIARTIEGDRE